MITQVCALLCLAAPGGAVNCGFVFIDISFKSKFPKVLVVNSFGQNSTLGPNLFKFLPPFLKIRCILFPLTKPLIKDYSIDV